MTKRANGEGSISKRKDGTWLGQVTIGRNHITGKLIRKSVYGKTRNEVSKKLTKVLSQVNNNSYIKESDINFYDWFMYWLENFKKHQVANFTYQHYLYIVRKSINKIRNYKLKDVNTFILQNLYNEMIDQNYSQNTIKKVNLLIDAAFKQALKFKIINQNPCDAVVLLKDKKIQIK